MHRRSSDDQTSEDTPRIKRDIESHCAAILAVLQAAGVGMIHLAGAEASAARILVRPAMKALDFSPTGRKSTEARLGKEPERFCAAVSPTDPRAIWVPMSEFTRFLHHGRHPVCVAYYDWMIDTVETLLRS